MLGKLGERVALLEAILDDAGDLDPAARRDLAASARKARDAREAALLDGADVAASARDLADAGGALADA